MNKLDIRDYLWHAYNIRCLSVRSFIKQAPVQMGKPGISKPQLNRWYRPKASKKMTVEMDQPFVWPEEPEDYSPWSREIFREATNENERYQERYGRLNDTWVNKDDRSSLREQAKALLEGKEAWKPLDRTALYKNGNTPSV